MKILLSNDDGWDAPGLSILTEVASKFGEVWVVAPDSPQSGVSHQLTLERPMELKERGPNLFSLDGTPADCARVGLTQLGQPFDWVLSGINHGANLGSDIFVSGTVAAAREAFLMGTPAIALSQYLKPMGASFEWTSIRPMILSVIELLLIDKPPRPSLLNVNFPDRSEKNDWGQVAKTECAVDLNPLPFDYAEAEPGQYKYAGSYHDRLRNPGEDIDVCFSGDISISRIH